MSKFGELINGKPNLIFFTVESDNPMNIEQDKINVCAADLEGKCKVTKIDINKNLELCDTLKITGFTALYYCSGQLVQRFTPMYSVQEIIDSVLTDLNNNKQ